MSISANVDQISFVNFEDQVRVQFTHMLNELFRLKTSTPATCNTLLDEICFYSIVMCRIIHQLNGCSSVSACIF